MTSRSRRTINDKSHPVIRITVSIILVLLILLLVGWAGKTIQNLIKKGPSAIAGRLSDASRRHVTIGSLGFSFPNRVCIYQLAVTENNDTPLFSCDRIEAFIDWQILRGRLHITRLDLFKPTFRVTKNEAGHFNMDPADAGKLKQRLTGQPSPANVLLDPLKWPLSMDLSAINMHEVFLHLEDSMESIPLIEGHFEMTLEPDPEPDNLYPKIAEISRIDMVVSHHGLDTKLSGSVEIIKNLATPALEIDFGENGHLQIRGAVRDYFSAPVCRLQLDGRNFKPSVLAPLLMQPFYFDAKTFIEGALQIDDVKLFDSTLPRLGANFTLQDGSWRFNPIKLTLPDDYAAITGDITFYNPATKPPPTTISPDEAGRITFQFDGTPLPKNLMLDTLYNRIGLHEPPQINEFAVAASLRKIESKISITSITVNGENGALILEGKMDPFTTRMQMAGTFLVPLELLKKSPQGYAQPFSTHDGKAVYPVSIHGSVGEPEIKFRTIEPPSN